MAKAEVVQGRMARKVDDAAGRLKKRRERKGMWEEVNGTNKFDKLETLLIDEADLEEEDNGWEDEDMDQEADSTAAVKPVMVENLPTIADTKLVVVDRTASVTAPSTADGEDEADKIT